MSYTTVYAMPHDRELYEVAEFTNAWGSAMRVWQALAKQYLVSPGAMFSPEPNPLWQLHKDARLTRAERAVHLWTYDTMVVESEALADMATYFETFERLYPAGDSITHLPALARLYREHHMKSVGDLGLCVAQTSVAGDVWYRSRPGDDESHLYNASIDNDHAFVFTSLVE